MAAETVVIDIQANYSDRMSPNIDQSGQKLDKMAQSIEKTMKQVEALGKSKSNPTIDVQDKATTKIEKVGGLMKSLAKSVVRMPVSILDKATAPLRGIMNYALSLKGVLTGIVTGAAVNTFVSSPIALADQIETAQIGFETMLGSAEKATQMMDKIKQFAAKTPFDTTGVVSSVQQMLRAGWDVDQVMIDIEKIGNAAAAAGQGTEGVQGIVLALQQMSMAGKLNAQDMMQLTNRGVKAWQYVADEMGVSVQEARKMSQDGLIPVDRAIQGIINGMGEYDGMMDKMSTRTVHGLMSNLQDTFDIKIVEKWGKGLVNGATDGLAAFGDFLDSIDPLLNEAGTSLEGWGLEISTAVFDVLEDRLASLKETMESEDFKNASGFEKLQIAWDKVISEPFGEWWDAFGYPAMVEKMGNLGEGLSTGISNTLIGLLGWNAEDVADDAATIGGSFAAGFISGFDGSGILGALTESISNAIQDALKIFSGEGDGSSWLSAALLGYGGVKVYGGVKGLRRMYRNGKALIPTLFGTAEMQEQGTGALLGRPFHRFAGTGAAGVLGRAGVSMGSNATTAGGMVAAGGAGIAGVGAGVVSAYHAGSEYYDAIQAEKAGNLELAQAKYRSGNWTSGGLMGGMLAGATIGSFIPGVGTVIGGAIGAGVGGIAGWWRGSKEIREYEDKVNAATEAEREAIITKQQDKYATEEMKDAVRRLAEGTITTEQFNQIWQTSAEVADDVSNRFGKLALSMDDINSIAEKMILGDATKTLREFGNAAEEAQNAFSDLSASQSTMVKMNWKAHMGFINDEQSIAEFQAGISGLVENAKKYIENSHFEATAAINVFLEPGASDGETDLLNTVYANINEQLTGANDRLQRAVESALADGVISTDDMLKIEINGVEIEMNEAEAIRALQDKVTEITEKVANAKHDAKMSQIRTDFEMSDLTKDSWDKMQAALISEMQNKQAALEDAYNSRLASYNLEYEEGLISKAELTTKSAQAKSDYVVKVREMKAEVDKFNFDTLEQTYGNELNAAFERLNLTGTFEEKFKTAMNGAEYAGLDLAEYLFKDMSTDEVSTASRFNIQEIADSIVKAIPEEISNAIASMDASNPVLDKSGLGFLMTGGLSEAPELPEVSAAAKTAAETAISEGLNEFDPSGFSGIVFNKTSEAITSDFAGNTIRSSVNIVLDPNVSLSSSGVAINASGGATGSAAVNFSVSKFAEGGIAGNKVLSWLAEEGYPEFIIPTAPHRRSRALELLAKAEDTLGVEKHASGGIVGGMLPASGSGRTSAGSSGNQISVNVGGITISVNSESDGNGDIVSAIRSKTKEISGVIQQMVAEALGEAFENMPLAES